MKTSVFADASNLFYGGEKSLGWKVDYQKLFHYLQEKYNAGEVFYFGGIEVHDFPYDYLTEDTVPLVALENHLMELLNKNDAPMNEEIIVRTHKHLQRVKFFKKLE